MHTYYISNVKYNKVDDKGFVKAVSEQYLIDAVCFTDAETRTIEEITPFLQKGGTLNIDGIVKPRIAELITAEDVLDNKFYKVKYQIITLDDYGTEKRTNETVIVYTNTIEAAVEATHRKFAGTTIDYCITSVVETPIVDFFPYKEKDE